MNERAKITASHLARQAIVYLRQSSAAHAAFSTPSGMQLSKRATRPSFFASAN